MYNRVYLSVCERTNTFRDVSWDMASIGELQGEGGVDLDAEVGVVAVLEEDAEALLARLHHLLEPRAAV